MIDFEGLKHQLLGLLFKSFNKILVERTVKRDDGTVFLQHFWVSPKEVSPEDKVRYNRHLLSEDHPQRHNHEDDITNFHEFESKTEIENILGGWSSKPDLSFPNWIRQKTSSKKQFVLEYTGGPCRAINSYLRGIFQIASALTNKDQYWNTRMVKRILPDIFGLDQAISEFDLPIPIRVHRIVSKDMLQTFIDAQKSKDGIFVEDGYCSTSLLKGSFGDEETDISLVIDVPAGKGIGAYIDSISAYPGEFEFLLARGTMLKIHSITPATKNHGPIIHMEAVGRKENINVMTPSEFRELENENRLKHLKEKFPNLKVTSKSSNF